MGWVGMLSPAWAVMAEHGIVKTLAIDHTELLYPGDWASDGTGWVMILMLWKRHEGHIHS